MIAADVSSTRIKPARFCKTRSRPPGAWPPRSVPVPRSWVTGDLALLRELASVHPLVIKPYRGHRGAGVVVIRSAADLAALPPPAQPVLVQQFIAGPGGDLKVYVVGDQVFAVRKPFSDSSFRGIGVPCAVTAPVRDIALRCGRAFGLGLYGIDIIESLDGPVVVDLNYSPGFRGVADAASPIARYIEDFAHARITLPVNPPALRVTAWAGFLAKAAA